MNNKLKLFFFLIIFVCLLLCSCNTTLLYKSSLYVLQCRTKNMINMFLKRADTVYCYSSGFDDYCLIWYHKDNYLYSYYVRPYKTVKIRHHLAPSANGLSTGIPFSTIFSRNSSSYSA